MNRSLILVACLAVAFAGALSSTVDCTYKPHLSVGMGGNLYMCFVNNDPNILTEESADINGVSGTLDSSKTYNDVLGFHIEYKTIQFFPKGFANFFKNIKSIHIYSSELKEIHRSDLKDFSDLTYFYLFNNQIEVIEEGLFNFNPNLEVVCLWESKIIHIDSNVFDNLNKLSSLYLKYVPCIRQDIVNSRSKVIEAIKLVKSSCSNSDFLSLGSQIDNLQLESKTLSSESFNSKLKSIEESFKNSKFSKFRPLNYKFQALKSASVPKQSNQCAYENDGTLTNFLVNITKKFEDNNSAQCGLKRPLEELKATQNALQTTLSGTDSRLAQIQKFQNQLSNNLSNIQNNLMNKFQEVSGSQKALKELISAKVHDLKAFQDASLSSITYKFNEINKDIKSTQDEAKLSFSDIAATLSDHSNFQTETKESLVKIKTVQNEIKKSLNDLNAKRQDSSDDKFLSLNDKIEGLEGRFMDFEEKLDHKFQKNEKELTGKLHKMSTNFDEKVKGIEKRLAKKFEEILEEKLGKVLDEKLGNILDEKLGKILDQRI